MVLRRGGGWGQEEEMRGRKIWRKTRKQNRGKGKEIGKDEEAKGGMGRKDEVKGGGAMGRKEGQDGRKRKNVQKEGRAKEEMDKGDG